MVSGSTPCSTPMGTKNRYQAILPAEAFMTTDHTRSIEDRLLVIETRLDYLATKAELQGLKTELLEAIGSVRSFTFTLVAPIYLLLIAQLAAGVWYFATH